MKNEKFKRQWCYCLLKSPLSLATTCFVRKARNFYGEKPFLNKVSAHDIATPSSLIHLHQTNVSFLYLFSLFSPCFFFLKSEEAVMAMFQLISISVFAIRSPFSTMALLSTGILIEKLVVSYYSISGNARCQRYVQS